MITQAAHAVKAAPLDSKRWLAKFSGEFKAKADKTILGRTDHYGPLRVQRPFYPEGPDLLHLYLLHPPGGLVGGDKLSIELDVQANSKVLMTTPSAGKMYRNISGLKQAQHVDINIEDGAVVEYLPQENIVFNGAYGQLNTEVDIKGSGLFIGWEMTCLGRFESNEMFEKGELTQSLMIKHDGRPLFMDRLVLAAPCDLQTSMAGFQGKSVFGNFVINRDVLTLLAGTNKDFDLAQWQAQVNEQIAPATLAITQKPNVFIARILGDKAQQARNVFEELWGILRPCVLQREACAPRIWRT